MAEKSTAELKAEYTDKYVQADTSVPELARFGGMTGRVVTVNENRLALVDFGDGPWYDIALDRLNVVPKPAPPPKPAARKAPPAKTAAAKKAPAKEAPAKKPAPKQQAESKGHAESKGQADPKGQTDPKEQGE
jgi:hypothetical protein